MSEGAFAGGCQCGAVRYEITGPLNRPAICHCRMCQKAFGSFFAPLVSTPLSGFRLTRGEFAVFKSSDVVERGFCRNCGTPLTFYDVGSPNIDIAIGSLDDPAAVQPVKQVGIEARLPWFGELVGLPETETADNDRDDRLKQIAETNRQHPDHDTDSWRHTPSSTGHSV